MKQVLLMTYITPNNTLIILKRYTNELIEIAEIVKEKVLEEVENDQHAHNDQLWKVSSILSNLFP